MPSAVWSPKAEHDLEEILFYIRVISEKPLTARRIGEEIVSAVDQQAALPGGGARYVAAPSGWRYMRHKRWLIFFQSHALGIEIMRVVDAARDLPRALAEGPCPE